MYLKMTFRGIFMMIIFLDFPVSIWNDAFVNCSTVKNVTDKLLRDIDSNIKYYHKKRNTLSTEAISDLKEKWNKVFDIALCHCFVDKIANFSYADCKCPAEKKLVNYNTYIGAFHLCLEAL